MLRFSKISLFVVFCCVAILVAPPAAHAQPAPPQITLVAVMTGTTTVTGQLCLNGQGAKVTTGTTQVGSFTVNLTGKANNTGSVGKLQLTGTVTGGAGQTLTIQLTQTGFTQMGPATFASNYQANITGPGSASFQTIFSPQGIPPPTPTLDFGTFTDPSVSGSGSQQVTDTGDDSTTLQSTIIGGDVTIYDFSTSNSPN